MFGNVVYAYLEGGIDRYHVVWMNSDGDTITKDVWGREAVERFKKWTGAQKIIWVAT